ncbi:MAG: carboxymuconolactone decarboxylase family protein [Verrucomicrobiota bacterium]
MNRIDYFTVKPEFITQLRTLTKSQEQFTLSPKLRALVETRVSQINGCVYCTDLHLREARALGESQQRLDTLAVWPESPFFDAREKAALSWAESLTLIPDTHADEAAYAGLQNHFSATEIVELSLSISLANFWNRLAGGFRKMPAQAG